MINRFRTAVLAAAVLVLGAMPAQAADKEKVLNLYIWSDYLAPDTIENFTKKTGIKVNVDVFDSSEALEGKLLAGASGYDVVVPNGPILNRFIKAGVVQPLDKSKLPHIKTQDPNIVGRAAAQDPGNTHGIVYMWGASGLGYNVAKVAGAGRQGLTDSWKLILDPANAERLSKCGIYVFDSPTDIFELTLNYIGKDPHSAVREVKEETGLDVAVTRIISVHPVRPRHMEVVVAGTVDAAQAIQPSHEIFEGAFVAPGALPADMMPSQGEWVRRALKPAPTLTTEV